MLSTLRAYGGMTTAPHHLASQAGIAVLREGGNAAEAMLAMAATVAVVYPHMNAIGGDGFWLACAPGQAPVGIRACGPAAAAATSEFYAAQGCRAIPGRGGLAALTVAGTVGGWIRALELAHSWGGRIPLPDLLADAIAHGRGGVAVTAGQERLTAEKLDELRTVPGFAETFLPHGEMPRRGARLTFDRLAATLEHLGRAGLGDFYRGDVARALADDLDAAGSPVTRADLESYEAAYVAPLSVRLDGVQLFNLPPPTQGIASLMILAILDRLGCRRNQEAGFVHDIVEATKQAFLVRDGEIRDPDRMNRTPSELLAGSEIDRMTGEIDRGRARPWPHRAERGDTIWMGAVDGEGRAVSFIQSIYWEFGSGVVLPATGVLWQNRGTSFALERGDPNRLEPGRFPFHTLNPALARFDDGRTMVYGTMGGEGQPQTQAALFARYFWCGMELQSAITAPRWLLGRTWGEASTNLKLEDRFDPGVLETLRLAGHDIEVVESFSDVMGHAGAVVRHRDGLLEGATDPRSDGSVAAC